MEAKNKVAYYVKLIGSIIILISVCTIISILYLYFFNYRSITSQDTNYISTILDMQANTLTITAITISLVALMYAIITFKRENEIKNIEEKLKSQLEESKQIIERSQLAIHASQQAIETLSCLSVYNAIDDIALFSLKEKYLNKQLGFKMNEYNYENNEFEIIYSLAKYYLENSLKLGSVQDVIVYLKKAMKYCNKIIEQEKDELKLYLAYFTLGDTYYRLASTDKYSQKRENIRFALENYEHAHNIDLDDPQGSIHDKIGLCIFWQYMTDKDFFNEMQNSEYIELLELANEYYGIAIEKNSSRAKYHNDLGCGLLQLHKIFAYDEDKRAKLLEEAMEHFLKSAKYDTTDCKPWINIADILIMKVKALMKIDKPNPISLRLSREEICFNLASNTKDMILKLLKEAAEKLNYARSINPLFLNSYYKLAEVEMYLYILSDTKEQEELKSSIIDRFKQASQISPSTLGILKTQRTFYDLMSDKDMVTSINNEIRKNSNLNAVEWDTLTNSNVSVQSDIKF